MLEGSRASKLLKEPSAFVEAARPPHGGWATAPAWDRPALSVAGCVTSGELLDPSEPQAGHCESPCGEGRSTPREGILCAQHSHPRAREALLR